MADQDRPQVTLITPPAIDLETFPDRLAAVLDSTDIACARLALAGKDEDMIQRAADACRLVSHARDVAIVIENHLLMVERLGLDGVHLTDGARQVRYVRKELGAAGKGGNVGAAALIGKRIAEKAKAAGVEKVAFDRSGFAYHGRVKALAEAAREAGLQF